MADEELEAPEVHAVVVAGTAPGTEAVDVLIAWDDLAEIEAAAATVLEDVREQLGEAPSFAGEVRFFLAPEFVADDPEAISALASRLRLRTALWRTSARRPWAITVIRGLSG